MYTLYIYNNTNNKKININFELLNIKNTLNNFHIRMNATNEGIINKITNKRIA